MSEERDDIEPTPHVEDIGEEDFQEHLAEELESTQDAITREIIGDSTSPDEQRGQSWAVAGEIVKQFRPVPWVIWKIVRWVYGRSGEIGTPHPLAFSFVDRLIVHGGKDKVLCGGTVPEKVTLQSAVESMGTDVAAAMCLIHALCRRISSMLPEQVWRPILDDALLRAQLGLLVGENSGSFGRGRGMLAGFSGRSGLAVLIASGTTQQAEMALQALASGGDIRDVGLSVYGCEPLQVSALVLSASGCSREAAFGTASYAMKKPDVDANSPGYRWLAAFAITEGLRMGQREHIEDSYWAALDFDGAKMENLLKQTKQLQRRGHRLAWLTWPQLEMEERAKRENAEAEAEADSPV